MISVSSFDNLSEFEAIVDDTSNGIVLLVYESMSGAVGIDESFHTFIFPPNTPSSIFSSLEIVDGKIRKDGITIAHLVTSCDGMGLHSWVDDSEYNNNEELWW